MLSNSLYEKLGFIVCSTYNAEYNSKGFYLSFFVFVFCLVEESTRIEIRKDIRPASEETDGNICFAYLI